MLMHQLTPTESFKTTFANQRRQVQLCLDLLCPLPLPCRLELSNTHLARVQMPRHHTMEGLKTYFRTKESKGARGQGRHEGVKQYSQ